MPVISSKALVSVVRLVGVRRNAFRHDLDRHALEGLGRLDEPFHLLQLVVLRQDGRLELVVDPFLGGRHLIRRQIVLRIDRPDERQGSQSSTTQENCSSASVYLLYLIIGITSLCLRPSICSRLPGRASPSAKAKNTKRHVSNISRARHPQRITTTIHTNEMASAIQRLASVSPIQARWM